MNLKDDLSERLGVVRACVIGDVMLDEYILGSVCRISPEAPVPVLQVEGKKHVPGGAANVAANIAALGTGVALTGFATADSAGQVLRGLLAALGIGVGGLVDPGDRGTICKTRIVAGRQQIVRVDHETKAPFSAFALEAAAHAAERSAKGADVAVLSDYGKGLLTEDFCRRFIEDARRRALPVIVDPKGHDFRKYRGCTIVTPNLSEAMIASGEVASSEGALFRAGQFLLRLLPGTGVLITRGADGMTLFREGFEPVTVPAVARQVYDVVGAGDTVVAVLAACIGAGFSIEDAMRLANIGAGIAVDKPGTATVTIAEILRHEGISGLRYALPSFTTSLVGRPAGESQ